MVVNGEYYGGLTRDSAMDLLQKIAAGKVAAAGPREDSRDRARECGTECGKQCGRNHS